MEAKELYPEKELVAAKQLLHLHLLIAKAQLVATQIDPAVLPLAEQHWLEGLNESLQESESHIANVVDEALPTDRVRHWLDTQLHQYTNTQEKVDNLFKYPWY